MGLSYYIGESKNNSIKPDFFYTDKFIRPYKEIDKIRLATIEEIAALKIESQKFFVQLLGFAAKNE